MCNTNDNDARDWIVEYQPPQAGQQTWTLPTVFAQRDGRLEYAMAVAAARHSVGQVFALERKNLKRRERAEMELRLRKQGAVTLDQALKELLARTATKTGTLWRARHMKTGEVIPAEALGL